MMRCRFMLLLRGAPSSSSVLCVVVVFLLGTMEKDPRLSTKKDPFLVFSIFRGGWRAATVRSETRRNKVLWLVACCFGKQASNLPTYRSTFRTYLVACVVVVVCLCLLLFLSRCSLPFMIQYTNKNINSSYSFL